LRGASSGFERGNSGLNSLRRDPQLQAPRSSEASLAQIPCSGQKINSLFARAWDLSRKQLKSQMSETYFAKSG
jgi:hypothetical protein